MTIATFPLPQASALTLTALPPLVNQPIGIAYQEVGNCIVVSHNRDTENAPKFSKIDANGVVTDYGIYVNSQLPVTEFPGNSSSAGPEIKLASIRKKSDGSPATGGFTLGEIFCSDSRAGNLMKIGADGKVAGPSGGFPVTWLHLPTAGLVNGIAHDRDGIIPGSGGCLIVATSDGVNSSKIWLIKSDATIVGGQALNTANNLPSNIEAILVVPNDSVRYGAIAGQILVGSDKDASQGGLWSVNPVTGATTQWFVTSGGALTSNAANGTPIAAEDLDIINTAENFYTVNFTGSGLFNIAPSSGQFPSGVHGDILVTQETAQKLQRIQASVGNLTLIDEQSTPISITFEHSAFGPVATLPIVSVEAVVASTVEPTSNAPAPIPGAFVVKRNTPGAELVVSLQFSGAAEFGADYSASPVPARGARIVVIPENQTQIEILIAAVDDSRQESSENVVCQIVTSTSPTYRIAAPPLNSAVVTILSNDMVPQPSAWQLIDLGVLGGNQSVAYAIASPAPGASATAALITGSSTFAAGNVNTRGFRSIGGGAMTAISTSSSYLWHIGYGVTPDNSIVGTYMINGTTCPRAFVQIGTGPLVLLDGLGFDSEARDRNGAGHIAGGSKNGVVKYRAVRWDFDGSSYIMRDLNTLAGTLELKSSYAFAINENNRVVGKSDANIQGQTVTHAFRTRPNATINQESDDLGTLPGYTTSEAYDINNLDEVVGISGTYGMFWPGSGTPTTQYRQLRPVFYSAGYDYTRANAINDLGIIVGARWSGVFGKWLMVLWWNSSNPTALDILPVESGFPTIGSVTVVGGGSWDLGNVLSINDRNWAVGWGYRNGIAQPRAFLLRPTNSP